MYAIFDRETGQLSFALRIAPGFRGRWQEGVTLDPLPADLSTLPDGSLCDDRVVSVRSVDHSHYRVFSDTADVEGSGFRSTGLIYGGTFDDLPPPPPREAASMGVTGP
jgi:hypothetical protein